MTATRADGRPRRPAGQRLSNPRDPAVQAALRRACSVCHAEPGQWCVGVTSGPMRGRRLTRLHSGRCDFKPNPPGSQTGADR